MVLSTQGMCSKDVAPDITFTLQAMYSLKDEYYTSVTLHRAQAK